MANSKSVESFIVAQIYFSEAKEMQILRFLETDIR